MAYPSGTFSNPAAGVLCVTFSARYSSYQGDFGSGTSDIRIACVVKDASNAVVAQCVISRNSASLPVALNYPGGSVSWTVEMTYLSHSIAGAGWVKADNLNILVELFKR
jgi:hypothetical protein